VVVRSQKSFSCSAASCLSGFYRTTNTILNIVRRPSENVMMDLLYTTCISYASEVKVFSHKETMRIHVACNDAIRKIFTFNRWESVKTLHKSFGYLSMTELFASRRKSFEKKMIFLPNDVIHLPHSIGDDVD
jgi:ATP-dependent helicase YprA (DUF1998 family)